MKKAAAVILFSVAILGSWGLWHLWEGRIPPSSVPASRLAHLKHGINLSGWFVYVVDHRFSIADVDEIKLLGFDHVRLGVDPDLMSDTAEIGAVVKQFLERDVAVVLDIHPDSPFHQSIRTDDGTVKRFSDSWRSFARYFSSYDPERVFFGIMNETQLEDRERWYSIQARLAKVIRSEASRHTLIAAGAHYSNIDELIAMRPLSDSNVIYDFHFYVPGIFTHQGATWAVPYYSQLKGVPYPLGPEASSIILPQVPDETSRQEYLQRYGHDRWDAARIGGEFEKVSDWSRRWKVPVICEEFGAFRKNSKPKDRVLWISDTRSELEKRGIGWAMWEYDGGFGLVDRKNGRLVPDLATYRALFGRNAVKLPN